MNYLLDTHSLLWYLTGDEKISGAARNSIEDPNSRVAVSIASLWEIGIKAGLGKLDLEIPLTQIAAEIEALGFQLLPISVNDILELTDLPLHHRNPFDRMIICQARTNGMILISNDSEIDKYEVDLLW